MSQLCVIVGAGGQARVVLALIAQSAISGEIAPAFVADLAPKGVPESILGCQVLSLPSDVRELKLRGITAAVIAVGDNEVRRRHFESFVKAGFEMPNLISRRAFVDPSAQLGSGNVIAHGAHIGPCVRIGSNNIINTNANVEHECDIGNHCHLAPGSILCGRAHIHDGCMVGAGAIVVEGKRLAAQVFVGAGGVVVADVTRAGSRLRGVPAREVCA